MSEAKNEFDAQFDDEEQRPSRLYKRSMTAPGNDIEMNVIDAGKTAGIAQNSLSTVTESSGSAVVHNPSFISLGSKGRLYSMSIDESNLRSFRQTFDGSDEFQFIIDALNQRLDIFASQSINFFAKRHQKTNEFEKQLLKEQQLQNSINEKLDENESEKDNINENDKDFEKNNIKGSCSTVETMFNTFNYMLGPVVLTMPYSMVKGGSCIAFIIIFVNIITFYTAYLMNIISEYYPNVVQFSELVEITLGKTARTISAAILIIELYFYVILFLIFSGSLLYDSGYLELMGVSKYVTSSIAIIIMFFVISPSYYLKYVVCAVCYFFATFLCFIFVVAVWFVMCVVFCFVLFVVCSCCLMALNHQNHPLTFFSLNRFFVFCDFAIV